MPIWMLLCSISRRNNTDNMLICQFANDKIKMMKKIFLISIAFVLCLNVFAQKHKDKASSAKQEDKVKLTSAALGKISARHIGPALTGGRITAIDGVNNDPRIMYIGTAGGGVWKTTNGGADFNSVFDKHCQSIGAVAIDQTNADVVWVGTGESNMRNTVSIGNGIYKTTDGGENWVFMGLPNSEHISKVVINPKDPNTVYVAVPGKLWSNSPDRGLYKTTLILLSTPITRILCMPRCGNSAASLMRLAQVALVALS